MSARKPSRLGRGLASLVSTPVSVEAPVAVKNRPAEPSEAIKIAAEPVVATAEAKRGGELTVIRVGVELIEPNPYQPRQRFDEAKLGELAASIRAQGVMQPVLLRRHPKEAGRYQLIAGERRWRAAQLAGLTALPAIVQVLEDQKAAEWALIENLQREDLNPMERAGALEQLVQRHGVSHEELAQQIGLDRSTVTNLLRLLQLAEGVQGLVRGGRLAMGHARALVAVGDERLQTALAERAVREGWSVRRMESEVRRVSQSEQKAPAVVRSTRQKHLEGLERHIASHLGLKTRLSTQGASGAGTVAIQFASVEEFESLLERLGIPEPE
ncbi:MAG: ParB/RepB/Spo0J family partition protein [Phycisphaeraceae bacterium]